MRFKTLAVGAVLAAGAALAPDFAPAAALPGSQGTKSAVEVESLVEEVRRSHRHHGHRHHGHRHHGHRHHRHRHFGHHHRHRHHHHHHFRHRHFYGYGYGYGSGYGYDPYARCTRVRHACADYWGWGSWEFYECIHDRGC